MFHNVGIILNFSIIKLCLMFALFTCFQVRNCQVAIYGVFYIMLFFCSYIFFL
jgi:hypothetical protein